MNRYSIGSIAGILVLWEILVRGLEVPKFLLPAPTTIITYIIAKSQLLVSHTLMTFMEAGTGFIIGSIGAILTAIAFLWSHPFKEMFYPYAVILNSTPIVAIAAPIVIIFGSGMWSKVITAVICVYFPVLGPTFKALASVGASELKWMDSYHSSRWQKFRYLQFPFALPQMFASFKVAWTLAVIVFPFSAIAQEAIVHEAWFVHMESAGGWVAVEKGFYGKIGVKEVQGGPGISPIQKVVASVRAGNIAFGNDYPENIIRAREKEGIDLVVVSVDFQTSAMRIISWNPIKSAKDIKGNFGIWIGYDAKAKCAVGKGWEKQFTIQNQGGDIKPWLMGTWPLASAMTYNELITAQRETKKMGKKFYTTDYKDLGIDWMDNVLFTTGEMIKKYPEVVQAVVAGRYKGFQWALDNPKETFEMLKKTNEGLDFAHEMDAVAPMKALMITADTKKNGLGFIHPKKWENVAKDMFKAGLLEKMPEVKKVYSDRFPSGVIPK